MGEPRGDGGQTGRGRQGGSGYGSGKGHRRRLLLFGGGLALSGQFTSSGLTQWIGDSVGALGTLPILVIVLLVTTGVIFLTELTSNTATAATFLPVAGGIAMGMGMDPLLLAIPVALAATCAFMLPVATPPNAIAYGSGYVSIPMMIKGGIGLNLIGLVLITAVTMTLAQTRRRHSSFLNSPSERFSGHISVPAHAGAIPRTPGQLCSSVKDAQLQPAGGVVFEGPSVMLSGTMGSV